MPHFNKVILMGNLTRDPQLKHLPTNTSLAEFGLAMNRKFRTQAGEDREEVTFIDCAAFGRTGELIQQYFTKGKPIFIEGRLKYDSWEDKQGGGKRSRVSVVVDNFQFVGDGGRFGSSDDNAAGAENPRTRPGRVERRSREQVDDGSQYGDRSDSPFGQPAPTFDDADLPY